MTDYILIQGIVFGFFLALPVGPVGVLCVQRTLAEGRMHGLLSGLGAAFGEALRAWGRTPSPVSAGDVVVKPD